MKQISYYDSGAKIFANGEPIYINKVEEKVEEHLHAHDFIEIAYVISGTGIHSINGKDHVVSRGELFIINHEIPHEFKSFLDLKKSRLRIYNCIFKPEFLDYTLVNCTDFHNVINDFLFRSILFNEDEDLNDFKIIDGENKIIEEIYEKMLREYSLKEQGYIEILRAYLIELIINIFREYSRSNMSEEPTKIKNKNIIDKVIRYMKENYSKKIKTEDLSTIAFFSPSYFSKLFKESTLMTISEYIQNLRIKEACRLLTSTDYKVIEVALDVGYKDIKFFNQIFKKITGKTPSEYRNMSVERFL